MLIATRMRRAAAPPSRPAPVPLPPALSWDAFAALFDGLDDVQFWIKDGEGRYQRANRALVRHYGLRDSAAVLGRRDDELFLPHLAAGYMQDDRQVLAGGTIRDRIERVAGRDGRSQWHVTQKMPLSDRHGRIVGSAGITRALDPGSALALAATELQPVLEHLHQHHAAALDKPRLARLLGRSVRSLERRFLQALGMPLLAYQRQVRMRAACDALVGGTASVTAIALSLGYADHSHFTREFRRLYGVPPRGYRQRWARRGSLPAP